MIVSAIIVSYFSSAFILRAVNSILQSHIDCEIFVVDNSCDTKEINSLKKSLPEKVHLIVNNSNLGFATACNQAFKRSKGKYILLLNPDAYLLDGSLKRLCDFLEHQEDAGAVGPLTFWDDEKTFILPPSHMPNPFFDLLYHGKYRFPFLSRYFLLLLRYKTIKTARANNVLLQDNLSGGGVLLRREAINKVGGLFDERFFLYYEDSDLFLRMKKLGYRLYLEPQAYMIHHWNQSPEPNEGKAGLYERSNHYFMDKHYSTCKVMSKIISKTLLIDNSEPKEIYNAQDMLKGISVSDGLTKSYLFEWSPHKSLFPAMLYFGQGNLFKFSPKNLSLLCKGVYYGRFSDPDRFFIKEDYFSWIVD